MTKKDDHPPIERRPFDPDAARLRAIEAAGLSDDALGTFHSSRARDSLLLSPDSTIGLRDEIARYEGE